MFSVILSLLMSTSWAGFHDIKEKDIEGKDYKLEALKGKTVLVVNIASQCGFTGQLADLEKLHEKYQARGLVVLGVPSNEFGGQTPEDDSGMKEFCQKKYSVKFPLLSKGKVNGEGRRPLYDFLLTEAPQGDRDDIGWNFVKFLVSKDGKILKRWPSMTNPASSEVTNVIESSL